MKDQIYTTELIEEILVNHFRGKRPIPSIYYNGQIGLRKAGILFKHTNEEIVEITKCQKDILYFAENYCKILDPKSGKKRNIVLRSYQKDLLLSFQKDRFNIAAISRQVGMTIVETISLLHSFLFSFDRAAVLIDVKRDIAVEKLKKVKEMYRNIPFYMQSGIITSNAKTFRNEACNTIKIETATKHPIEYEIHDLYIGNFAYIRPSILENIYNSIIPCTAAVKDSRVIITSTPNGYNKFTELLNQAENGENNYKAHRVYWWQVPGRDESWKEQEIKKLGSQEAFEQEYELKFIKFQPSS